VYDNRVAQEPRCDHLERVTLPAHHRPGGGFRNPWPGAAPKGFAPLFRWFLERNTTRRPPPDPRRTAFPVATPATGRALAGNELAVTWVGQSTALIEFPGFRVLTDPMWGRYAAPLPAASLRRWVEPPLPLESLPRLDAVIVSHNHYDHLDAPTIRRLARLQPGVSWVTPLGNAPLLRRLGAGQVTELDWWGETTVGEGVIAATPAQHFSARGPRDRDRALWAGFAIRAGRRRVFFAGDTGYHPEFAAIGERFGTFDVQLLPVGAYEPRWFMRPVHMDPTEALAAWRELGGGILVPIHWGTFKLTDEPMDEPPRRTREEWRRAGRPDGELWLLRHGETRALGGDGSAGGIAQRPPVE
jgi:N-acyl-phosphatidylethanolamine-hydrolysing phospholipase D